MQEPEQVCKRAAGSPPHVTPVSDVLGPGEGAGHALLTAGVRNPGDQERG